jgi:hypothetical protein
LSGGRTLRPLSLSGLHVQGHRGVPNTEIVKRSDELVSEHGPISTAERESCKILRAVLSNDSSNILAGFSAEAQAAIIGLAEIAVSAPVLRFPVFPVALSRCGFLPQILATDITNKGLHDGIMAECPEMVATLLRLDESLDVCTPFAPAFCCLLMICADLDCIRASVDSCLWWGRQLFKVRFWFDLFLELSPVHGVELVVSQEIQLWNADFSASLFAEQQLSFFPSYVASIFSQLSKVCTEIPSFRG